MDEVLHITRSIETIVIKIENTLQSITNTHMSNFTRNNQNRVQLQARVDESPTCIKLSQPDGFASPTRPHPTAHYGKQDSTPGAAGRYASPPRISQKRTEDYMTPDRLREGYEEDRRQHDSFYEVAPNKKDRLDCLFD